MIVTCVHIRITKDQSWMCTSLKCPPVPLCPLWSAQQSHLGRPRVGGGSSSASGSLTFLGGEEGLEMMRLEIDDVVFNHS